MSFGNAGCITGLDTEQTCFPYEQLDEVDAGGFGLGFGGLAESNRRIEAGFDGLRFQMRRRLIEAILVRRWKP